ncbi:MAG TPA: hypothetical protein VMH04_21945 [Candidatus Solibacter sp.]|nr:hypothetical protein [Candidatus Solibacter sp.]
MARFSAVFALAILIFSAAMSTGQPQQAGSKTGDRPKQDPAEILIVPADTKITVDVSEENPPRNLALRTRSAKVVNIVQVGSTVAIPALSKVTIQESVGTMELIDVTINGVSCKLKTDRITIEPGSTSEATFTLQKDIKIKR